MRIAIVGAGVGGMAAAYDLRKAGNDVTIFEASKSVGGLASGFKDTNWKWSVEQFYHHWFTSDHDMLGLIDELGWQDKVVFKRPFTVVYYKGEF
jgi:protoporphyrinogen oxidase